SRSPLVTRHSLLLFIAEHAVKSSGEWRVTSGEREAWRTLLAPRPCFSLRAPPRSACRPWPLHARLRHLIDLRKHQRRFLFQSCFHRFKIALGILPRAIFKTKIAQIVVNRISSLQKLVELAPMRRQVGSIGLNK